MFVLSILELLAYSGSTKYNKMCLLYLMYLVLHRVVDTTYGIAQIFLSMIHMQGN